MRLHWYILLLSLVLSGCVVRSAHDRPHDQPEIIYPLTEVSAEQVPFEIRLVGALVANKVLGNPKIPPAGLTFAPQGKHTVQGPGFPYKDATYQGIDIASYKTQQLQPTKHLADLIGILRFAHKDGRRAAAIFGAKYEVTPDTITIVESSIEPIQLKAP